MNECDKANAEHGEGIKELAVMYVLENLEEITCFQANESVAKCKTNSSTLKSFSPYASLIE